MFKSVEIINKFIEEREITFEDFIKKLKDFLWVNEFNKAVIINQSSLNKGISMTLTNKIYMDMKDILILNDLGVYCLEFKEFSNVIAIEKDANITLDENRKRLFLKDFNIQILFSKELFIRR